MGRVPFLLTIVISPIIVISLIVLTNMTQYVYIDGVIVRCESNAEVRELLTELREA